MREIALWSVIIAGMLVLPGCLQEAEKVTAKTGNQLDPGLTESESYFGNVDVAEPSDDQQITMGARLFVSKTDPTEGTIAVRVRLHEGWHLYATLGPDAFERQAELTLNETTGITEEGQWELPPATPDDKDVLKTLWHGDLVFTKTVRLGELNENPSVNFSYQACNETSCLPPTETEMTVQR